MQGRRGENTKNYYDDGRHHIFNSISLNLLGEEGVIEGCSYDWVFSKVEPDGKIHLQKYIKKLSEINGVCKYDKKE